MVVAILSFVRRTAASSPSTTVVVVVNDDEAVLLRESSTPLSCLGDDVRESRSLDGYNILRTVPSGYLYDY